MFVRRESPHGQMLVIVAVGLTALIAMTGLIIDGGMALSNRRQLQNASDAASLAGTRVLGLDLKWRASGRPGTAPFANPDAAVCDAINNALSYNSSGVQAIAPIPCTGAGSPRAMYVDFNRQALGRVGNGIPSRAQGVQVQATGSTNTMLMGVVGISTMNVDTDATALVGPPALPIGQLMPFVVQNPLGPFIPGRQYDIRTESEGECGAAGVVEEPEVAGLRIPLVFGMAGGPDVAPPVILANHKPLTPIASEPSQSFASSISVKLGLAADDRTNGTEIYFTTNGTVPTKSPTLKYNNQTLTFTATTTLQAIAVHGSTASDVGSFTYTKTEPPPNAVTASPASGTTFATSRSVTLTTTTSGATIHYTLDGSAPTSASPVYSGPITLTKTTQIRAVAIKNLTSSPAASFYYLKDGDTAPVYAIPGDGAVFESAITVSLATLTDNATIYYTTNGLEPTTSSLTYNGPIVVTDTVTVKAFATLDGNASLISAFSYTRQTSTCPDLSAGNYGWVDFSGGAGGNNELKQWLVNPGSAPVDWYWTACTASRTTNCRDLHNVPDPADDHWLIEGTSGHRQVSLGLACDLYVGKEVFIPIWDSFHTTSKKPNGANAVFHIIGFGVFKLDGIIDNKGNGDPSGDACGDGINRGGKPNDKGLVGTYVDSFIGSQVSPCIQSPDGSNPCTNLGANTAFTINLAK